MLKPSLLLSLVPAFHRRLSHVQRLGPGGCLVGCVLPRPRGQPFLRQRALAFAASAIVRMASCRVHSREEMPTPTAAKKSRGRPKKAAIEVTSEKLQTTIAETTPAPPVAEVTTVGVEVDEPKTPAKGRSRASKQQQSKESLGEPSELDEQPSTKRRRKAASPKRDKDAPLPRSQTPRKLEPPSSRLMRLVSVNVAGLRSVLSGEKANMLKAVVDSERPDVLCIQEHKLKEEDVADAEQKLLELLPEEYSTVHWSCSTAKKGYSGVAVVLRRGVSHGADETGTRAAITEPENVQITYGLGEKHKVDSIISDEGRVITMELPELLVVVVYAPNSGMDLQRLSYRTDRAAEQCWDRSLGDYVRELHDSRTKPVVVIGDLNCCHGVRDIWNMYDRPDFPDGLAAKALEDQYTGLTSLRKSAGLTPQERGSFTQLLADADLVDTFRALHPEASGVFSYFSQRAVKNRSMNKGLRLDYVLASSSLCAHLTATTGNAAGTEKETEEGELPLPRVHDSFVLDEQDLIADHAPVGCDILLPPA